VVEAADRPRILWFLAGSGEGWAGVLVQVLSQVWQQMRRNATIAVVIPTLNEEKAIGKVIAAIPSWVDDIVVADNGSTDQTPQVARSHSARVVHEPRRGYGSACLKAMSVLDGPDVVVFLDGDFSDHPEEMDSLVDPILGDQADIVIGSRVLGRCERGALTPQAKFGNWLSCKLLLWVWGVRYTDLGPFRAIRYPSLRRLGMCDPDYGWTVEMQVQAALHGLRATEVPVSYRPRIGKSKISRTLWGGMGAGTKILYAIFASAWQSRCRERTSSESHRKLIVFARYPKPGKVKTRLIPALGEEKASQLHRDMTAHTLTWAKRLGQWHGTAVEVRFDGGSQDLMCSAFGNGFRYVAQGPGDLGERMARAFDEAFSGGAEAVVIVGTDCPTVSVDLAQKAYETLRTKDLVLGPAHDGGYYLIGLRRPVRQLFARVSWGTGSVLKETVEHAKRLKLSYGLLEILHDVDRPEDLIAWEQATDASESLAGYRKRAFTAEAVRGE
jgi:rSAM/selenodomain-associated transferase 1